MERDSAAPRSSTTTWSPSVCSDDAKMINALQKSWQKMTPAAHAEALKLDFGPRERILVERALAM